MRAASAHRSPRWLRAPNPAPPGTVRAQGARPDPLEGTNPWQARRPRLFHALFRGPATPKFGWEDRVRLAVVSEPTLFEELGGEPVLRPLIDRFVDTVFDDLMIGFHFRAANRDRVKAKEYEFAAHHLGADVAYTGRDLQEAHAPHPILGGQFDRRLKILEETLEAFGVSERVKTHWLEHNRALRDRITRDDRCDAGGLKRLPGADG